MSVGEHPDVPRIEVLLGGPSTRRDPSDGTRPRAEVAAWFCACIAWEDAPIWLLHDTAGGGVTWCRVPPGVDLERLVDAEVLTGAHVDPEAVLSWLQDGSQPSDEVDAPEALDLLRSRLGRDLSDL